MSLSIIRYQSLDDLLKLNLDLTGHKKWKIVCPNPSIADAFRDKIPHGNIDVLIDTTTISKYLSDLLKFYFPGKEVYRKSKLFLMTATVWKMKFSNEDSSLFHQAFEIFTDLRSFTLNKQLIENLLEFYHPIVSEAIKTFWLVLESQEILDEHQAYYDLNAKLIDEIEDSAETEGVFFLGFTHLSANQIEVLKSLGKSRQVFLPVPKVILEEAQWKDWTKWVETQADNIIDLNKEGVTEKENRINTYLFPKGRGNTVLKSLSENKLGDILFFKKQLSFKEVMEVPSRNHFFKSDTNLFRHHLLELKLEIESLFLKYSESVRSQEVIEEIKKRLTEFKGNTFKEFKKFKVLQLIYKELLTFVNYSEENETMTSFDLEILWEVVELNLPRNFNIPLLKKPKNHLLSLKEVHKVSREKSIFFFVDDNHDLKSGGGDGYPPEVQEILFSLGPMRRVSLDIEFYQFYLRGILLEGNVNLVMESGLLEHDQSLNTLFNGMNLDFKSVVSKNHDKDDFQISLNLENYLPPSEVSATRLQTYMDCPRKYYFSYVEGLGQEPVKQETVDPRLLGQAEHEIVDKYIKTYNSFEEEKLTQVIDEIALSYFSKEILNHKVLKDEVYIELLNYTRPLILELLKLKERDPDLKLEFEVEVKAPGATGKIDLIVKGPILGTMLFDMKRSGSSIPEKREVSNINSIQILYYLKASQIPYNEFSAFGYLNLSELNQSLIYCFDSDVQQIFENQDFLNLDELNTSIKRGRQLVDTDDFYEEMELLIDSKVNNLKEDMSFLIRPANKNVCTYCPGKLVCDRRTS